MLGKPCLLFLRVHNQEVVTSGPSKLAALCIAPLLCAEAQAGSYVKGLPVILLVRAQPQATRHVCPVQNDQHNMLGDKERTPFHSASAPAPTLSSS